MVKGEFEEEDNSVNSIKEKKLKEQFLDEAFKKAENKHRVKQPDVKKTTYKKNFPKLWILLIAAAVIGLISVNYVSWGYIKYDTGTSEMEVSINRDFILYDEGKIVNNINASKNITNLFSKPYYLGLSMDDFISASELAYNGFICLIILGILIIIFGLVDKVINISSEIFIVIHFVISVAVIVPCMVIVLSAIKFIGVNILLYYNTHFITAEILAVAFPAAYILVTIGLVIIKLIFTVMRMDFKEMQKLLKNDVTEVTTPKIGE